MHNFGSLAYIHEDPAVRPLATLALCQIYVKALQYALHKTLALLHIYVKTLQYALLTTLALWHI